MNKLSVVTLLFIISSVISVVKGDCVVQDSTTLELDLTIAGVTRSIGAISSAADISSDVCSDSLCSVSNKISTLQTLTSNSTFCSYSTCSTNTADIAVIKVPPMYSGIANNSAPYDFTSYNAITFNTTLDTYNAYNPISGYSISLSNYGVYSFTYTLALYTPNVTGIPNNTNDTIGYYCGFTVNGSPTYDPITMINHVAIGATVTVNGGLTLNLLAGNVIVLGCYGMTDTYGLPLTAVYIRSGALNGNRLGFAS